MPPPSLPSPTLSELGLSLEEITSFIHTTPQAPNLPISGVFLAPHYLLLCHNQGLDVVSLKNPPISHPFALIRRVTFKSVVVMEERGVLVAIAGRREGVRVYALDEVRKAVEWRIQVEIERERDAGLMGNLMSGRKSGEMRFDKQPNGSGPRLRIPMGISVGALGGMMPMPASQMLSTSNPVTPVSEYPAPTSRERSRTRTTSLPVSPPPTYASLPPPVPRSPSPSRPSGITLPATTSAPTEPILEVLDTPASLSIEDSHTLRPRNASVSTISPGKPGRAMATGNGKAKEKERRKETSGDDQMAEKEDWIDRHADSDDEALDPVAAGSSGSAALDERTSAITSAAIAADVAVAMAGVSGSPVIATSPLSPAPSSSLATRRPSRPSNLDLSSESLGPSSLPVAASEPSEPTLMSLRQALALAGSVGLGRRTSFIPREPRASTSLSFEDEGANGSGAETPQEIGEDFISFTQAIAESRVGVVSSPPATSPTSFTQPGPSNIPGLFRPPVSASAALASLGKPPASQDVRPKPLASPSSFTPLKQNSTPPATSPSATAEAKKRRRFSLMGTGLGKSESASSPGPTRTFPPRMFTAPVSTGLAGASASTPNLTDAASTGRVAAHLVPPPANGTMSNGVSSPPGPSTVGRSFTRQRMPPPVNTIDRIFQPQSNLSEQPPSPFKLSTPTSSTSLPPEASSSSSAPQRSSRRFLPKLLGALRKTPDKPSKEAVRVRSEVERRLAAGGASSAAIMAKNGDGFGPSAANGGPETLSNPPQGVAPKLEYVKLPGTKGAIAIKAVETPRKR